MKETLLIKLISKSRFLLKIKYIRKEVYKLMLKDFENPNNHYIGMCYYLNNKFELYNKEDTMSYANIIEQYFPELSALKPKETVLVLTLLAKETFWYESYQKEPRIRVIKEALKL